jgi:hypothetical protein
MISVQVYHIRKIKTLDFKWEGEEVGYEVFMYDNQHNTLYIESVVVRLFKVLNVAGKRRKRSA